METKVISREASELGWKPGYRPYIVELKGMIFDYSRAMIVDGEVKGWIYTNRYSQNAQGQPEVINLIVYID